MTQQLGAPQGASGAQFAFPAGVEVRLKFTDTRETGIVTVYTGSKLVVQWPDLNRESKYFLCSLIPAEGRL